MVGLSQSDDPLPSLAVGFALLPDPDRRRSPCRYVYRLTYRNPELAAVGCVQTWDVSGGRLGYQIALERDEQGNLRLHCTCADAVFRAEGEDRFCKHIHGLLGLESPSAQAVPTPAGISA